MPERIVSAGVFTKEIDQSFLPAAIGQIGAAIVGPTVKGPALVPTKVSSFGDFYEKFGGYTDDSYVPYAVNEYLRAGNSLTVTRLLYEDGYKLTSSSIAIVYSSASTNIISHVLHPTNAITETSAGITNNAFHTTPTASITGSGSFVLTISGGYSTDSDVLNGATFLAGKTDPISSSINPNSNNYITKIFGKSPKSIDYPVYVQYENSNVFSLASNAGHITTSIALINSYDFSTQDYSVASTPWITSQKIGTTVKDLFRFHTLSHGTSVNHEVKVGIRDIRTAAESADPDGYGSFTIEIRRVNTTDILGSPYQSTDTDNVPDIVETFGNVNLNPDSANYIVNRIGDRYQTISDSGQLLISGDISNKSKYVRVEVKEAVKEKTNEKSLIPFGFRALYTPVPAATGSFGAAYFAAASYLTTQVNGIYSPSNYLGFNYSNATNLNYLCPLVNDVLKVTGSNSDFYLGNVSQDSQVGYPTVSTAYSGSLESSLIAGDFKTKVALSTRKFMVPFQGGFDGARPNLPKFSGDKIKNSNTFGFDCSSDTATGTKAYNKAFTLLSNTDFYDINMLITPGIFESFHSSVTALARNLCVYRQDTFYIMDTHGLKTNGVTTTIDTVVNDVSALDNNYTAAYWPWVHILNPKKKIPVWVPPSVVVPGALTFNDSVAAPWYAPAGLNRGGLPSVIEAYIPLSQAQRNALYEARINPIATFPNDGVVVWGQKTLQARPSALDRVNVRRLLITVKKFIASATRYLVFEQNNLITQTRFLNIVNPYLESVKVQQGLYAFKAVMDSTNNTPDLIDQNILYGQIFLQPTKTAEFIILDFNIQPTGAAFPE